MTQQSIFWSTNGTGDGAAPYTQSQLLDWLFRTFNRAPTTDGVHAGSANELAVSGATSPLSVATGAALVWAVPYENTAPVAVAVPTPTVGTTGHRVILRADWAAQTVRVALLSSTDGVAALPALTQNPGATYEVGLASLTITTLGAITVTDTRGYLHYTTKVNATMMDNRTRRVFISPSGGYNNTDAAAALVNIGPGVSMLDAKDVTVFGGFLVPSDFVSFTSIKTVLYPTAGGNAYIRTTANAAQPLASRFSQTLGYTATALSSGVYNEVQSLTLPAVPISAGSYVDVHTQRDATNVLDTVGNLVVLLGWVFEYTAQG